MNLEETIRHLRATASALETAGLDADTYCRVDISVRPKTHHQAVAAAAALIGDPHLIEGQEFDWIANADTMAVDNCIVISLPPQCGSADILNAVMSSRHGLSSATHSLAADGTVQTLTV